MTKVFTGFLQVSLTVSIFLLSLTGIAQEEDDFKPKLPDYVPPSPTAYELGKYGDVPVNESTGVANINIQLYTYETPNISVPISMDYATTGVKVQQVASWVGMGWNLNAGGAITRKIRGMPDEDAYARSFPSYSSMMALKSSDPSSYYDFIGKVGDKDHTDYVPDIFTFSVDGISGTFFLDANLNPVVVKKESEIRITKKTSLADGGFIVTTPKGVKYTFDVIEETKQRMNCGNQPSTVLYHPTTWYLSKIEHPLGDVVNFTYGYSTDYFYASNILETYSVNEDDENKPQEATLPSEGVERCSYDQYVKGKVLTSITSNRDVGSVTFVSSKTRSDLAEDYQLDGIVIRDPQNNQVKEFTFGYTDVQSTVSYTGGSSPFPGANSVSEKYRLFLDDITEKDANGNASNGKVYNFEYEDRTSLPRRLSMSQDQFGYYNGATNSSFLPNTEGTSPGNPFQYITKGDRSFNLAYAKKGILTKVTFPTKGYTIIEYESGVGSIRVKKIRSLPKAGSTEKVKKYYYTSRQNAVSGSGTESKVSFGVDDYIISRDSWVCYTVCPVSGVCYPMEFNFTRIVFSSNGLRPLYSTNANHYLYSKVTVGYGENFEGGGEEKLFRLTADQFGTVIHGTKIIGGARSNDGYYNGELMEERLFKKNGTSADLVRSTRYVYKEDATQEVTLDNYTGEKIFEFCQSGSDGSGFVRGYNVEMIQTRARWRSIDSVITREYFDSGKMVETVETRDYTTGLAGLPTEVRTSDSHGRQLKTKNTYTDLGSKNWFEATKVESFNGTNPIARVEREYYTNYGANTLILPKKIKTLKGLYNATTNPVEDRIEFISYYDNGNAKEVEMTDGTRIVYIWGYDQTKPIAKIENTTYSALVSALGSTTIADIQNASDQDVNIGSENTLRSYLDQIRAALPGASVSTFTYDPMFGVTSITDPMGKTTYYCYDPFTRLRYVMDDDRNIISKTEYNYKD